MRRVFRTSWLILAFPGMLAPLHAQQVQVSPANRTIAVTTTEDAERRADLAAIHIGYQLYAPTSRQVTEQAAKTSKAITAALAAAGLPQDALESESQSTGPVEDYPNNGLTPEEHAQRKFQAQQSWTARVPAAAAAKTLAAAVSAGANQSGAIDWSVADESSLSAEAAGKALKHAQAIARQMAAGLGATLGPLLYAGNQAEPRPILPMMARNVNGPLDSPDTTLSLSAPMVRRSATVSAVFSLQ